MRHKKSPFFFFLLLLLLSALTFYSFKKPDSRESSPAGLVSPLADSSQTRLDDLFLWLKNLTRTTPGLWGLYYLDLNSGQSLGLNENEQFVAASTAKVLMVVQLYQLAQEDKLNLDEKILVRQVDLQDYGTGTLRYQTPPIQTSWRHLSKLALNISDNTASHLIGTRLTYAKMESFVENQGLTGTSMKDNLTTPKDMAHFFQKLYQGQLLNQENTQEILNFMTQTETEDRIPAGLDSSLVPYSSNPLVFHKTGTQTQALSDVAVVVADSPYVLAIFTRDVPESFSKPLFAKISEAIFAYQLTLP